MIARFFLRHPTALVVTLALIIYGGWFAFENLPRLEDPVLSRRVAVVSTVYPQATPQVVESEVSVPLEQALAGFPEIKQVRSNSLTNISNVVIELRDQVRDVDPVWEAIRKQLAESSTELPDAALKPELDVFPLKAFATIIALQPNGEWTQERWHDLRLAAQSLKSRIESLEGTEEVAVFGDAGEELIVEFDVATLRETGMSTASVAALIAQQLGGEMPSTPEALVPALFNSASTVDAALRIAEVRLPGPQGARALSSIAQIGGQSVQPPADRALVGQDDAIVLGIMVDDEQRVDLWDDELTRLVRDFATENEKVLSAHTLFSQRSHIDHRMATLLRNLGLGAIAVVFVVMLMMGWRSMLVVTTALPLSALLVLFGLWVFRIPIHQMSVTGLIVALGLLIDNAIVIVEEVRGRMYAGSPAADAILRSVRHLAIPLLGSTLTTAFAFMPIAILPGPAGEFVGSIAISVILAITASFFLAMTVVPAMIGLFRVRPERRGLLDYGLRSVAVGTLYRRTLKFVFRAPIDGVFLGLILPVIGFLIARSLPVQFFPPSDRTQIQIEIERPSRDSIADVADTVEKIHEIVARDERLGTQNWFLGRSAPTFYYNVVPRRRGTPFYAQAFVDIESGGSSKALVRSLQRAVDQEVTDCRTIVRQLEQGPPFDAPVELRITGPEIPTLVALGRRVREVLVETNHVLHTRADLEDIVTRTVVEPTRTVGPSQDALDQFAYQSTNGAVAGYVRIDEEAIPIRVALSERPSIANLGLLPFPRARRNPSTGRPDPPMPFGEFAEVRSESDVGAVVRLNGQRINEVKAYITAGVLPSVVLEEFKERWSEANVAIPDGYELRVGGESEQRSNAVGSLMANVAALVIAMAVTLIAVFGSFWTALIVAIIAGLSIGLGPLALLVFGYPLGFMAIVGTMGLVGIAVNDSIVVLAAIRAMEPEEQRDPERVAETVFHCTRHILATTLTTIVGFLPLLLGAGEFWPPLAVAIAGGVGGATLLALYFAPSLYLLFFGRGVNPVETVKI